MYLETPSNPPGMLEGQVSVHKGDLGMEEEQGNEGSGRRDVMWIETQNSSAWGVETALTFKRRYASASQEALSFTAYSEAPLYDS